jgi:hypothetical protein
MLKLFSRLKGVGEATAPFNSRINTLSQKPGQGAMFLIYPS